MHLLGAAVLQQGRASEAVELLTKARRLAPKSAPCAMRLGLASLSAGQPKQAELSLREAVALQREYPEAWDHLAHCLKLQDRLPEAVECHREATTQQPAFALGWYNYGLTLSLLGRPSEALACHEKALAAQPDFAKAHFGRAQSLQQLHRISEAVDAYDTYLARQPGHHEAHSYRLFALNNLDGITREQLFSAHAAYGRRFPAAPALPVTSTDTHRRLRLAIFSPDLRAHSCAYFLEPLLAHLSRDEFEIYLYHDHFREDEVSRRFKGLAAVWRNFVGQPNTAVEPVIQADHPDLLIDLSGHTGMVSRLPLFARRMAPVQITYLGYPNTTGLTAIDYRFTDAVADPPGDADSLATERLIRFAPTAWTYQPPRHAPVVQPPPASLDANRPITFGCFNNLAKITDSMLRTWAILMAAVPDSRLVLKGRGLGDAATKERYDRRFAACGLPADRVDALERTARPEDHLALYHRVDIALDTAPYGGTTTTCEALWMGRPVVTLRGDRHAARVGASLLSAIGHGDWIADSPAEYVRIAAGLAADRGALAAIVAALRPQVAGSVLCDHAGQSRHFAAALRRCWIERLTALAEPALATG